MEAVCVALILLSALLFAILLGNNSETKKSEERAIRFAEECYIEGIIPIGEVKRMAAFYLMEEAKGKINRKEAGKRIEETLRKYLDKEGNEGK